MDNLKAETLISALGLDIKFQIFEPKFRTADRFDNVPDTANLIPDDPIDVPLLTNPLHTLSLGGKIEFPSGTPYDLTASWTTEDEYWTSPYP